LLLFIFFDIFTVGQMYLESVCSCLLYLYTAELFSK